MAKPDLPGAFEQLILLALARLGEGAYGMTVRREIEARAGREASLGAVYATLDRLEQKGYVASYAGEAAPERGMRGRRHFRLEAAGAQALKESLDALDRMREGVPGLRPAGAAS
jgi:PadR family transcriptional regulator, regulatory protein PadR